MASTYKDFSEKEVDEFSKKATKLCNSMCSTKRPSCFSPEEFKNKLLEISKDFTTRFISKPLIDVDLSTDEYDTIISNITNLAIGTHNQNIKCISKIGKKVKKIENPNDAELHIRRKIAKTAKEFNSVFKDSDFTFMYFTSVLSCTISELTETSNKDTVQNLIGKLI